MNLDNYDLSAVSGFLPQEPLLTRLPAFYNAWEDVCSDLPRLQDTGELENVVSQMPILSTDDLKTYPQWRRAYVMLGFIANAYLWGPRKPHMVLPASIAVPFLLVSAHLSMPPVPTYAAENLWNFYLIDGAGSASDPDNFRTFTSFTGTTDETWFYALPAAIEARGAPLIPLLLGTFESVSKNDDDAVTKQFQQITSHIQALACLLPRMYEKCDPDCFYNTVRPFLAGTTSAALPDGILYMTEEDGGSYQKFKGPTAAQSSLFQFLDIALGVTHLPTGTILSSKDVAETPRADDPFLKEMRLYMPEPHRRFLADVAHIANIRPYVLSRPLDNPVTMAYNDVLAALANYRNKHIQMVTKYVVIPSRAAARKNALPKSETGLETEPGTAGRMPVKENVEQLGQEVKESVALGTGGTAPLEFLKQVRNETKASIV